MNCGKKPTRKTDIIAKLRDLSSKKIEMNLNQFNMLFDNNNAEWKSKEITYNFDLNWNYFNNFNLNKFLLLANFNDVATYDKDKKIKELKQKNEEADLELKMLENIYLAKMSKLLLYSHIVIIFCIIFLNNLACSNRICYKNM